jgi:addiction module RelE/StbE family toxin
MKLRYSSAFKKQYKKLPKRTREQFKKRLVLFLKDDRDAMLHIHKLAGAYDGLWSMNVSGNIRAIFDRAIPDIALFVAIGSHSELYS